LLAKVDLAYSIIFFGVGAEGCIILKKLFSNRYKDEFIELLLNYLKLKPALQHKDAWIKWRKLSKKRSVTNKKNIINEIYNRRKKKTKSTITLDQIFTNNISDDELLLNYPKNYVKYYGGHQFRLGHYFRHLFQTVKYVDEQPFLKYKDKYGYIKTLRAQLSTYEQALLFLNSLSIIGRIWEYSPEYKKSNLKLIDSVRKLNKQFITKYNLIKNLPGDTIYGIPFKQFYPNVEFEFDRKKRDTFLYR
ncbi:putative phage abortive infection protein, partial [Chitinophaga sp.]|uniref:putative phage abortive infection protein n=1 Tax=Chitinophaga sp. TaxID=1869181 RepID=UPI0026272928